MIDGALSENVDKIIVVDNYSAKESQNNLESYSYNYYDKIKIIQMHENTGSAGGFKRGMEEAYKEDCDFIWLLDDDNVPQKKSLLNLILAHEYLGSDKNIALISYRKIIKKDNTQEVEHKQKLYNSVYYGKVLGTGKKFFDKFINFYLKFNYTDTKYVTYPIVKRNIGSYGGLFFKISLLEIIGYPDERFYLYADDSEYTYRMILNGLCIYTCYHSQIIDIDLQNRSKNYFDVNFSSTKIYYGIRNHTYLKYYVYNAKFAYLTSYLLFYKLLLKNCFKILNNTGLFLSRSKLIRKAISDGLNGSLGKLL